MKVLSRILNTGADAACAAAIFATIPLLRLAARGRFPDSYDLTRKISDAAGIAILGKHYYTPLVTPADIKADLLAERKLPGIDLDRDAQLALVEEFSFQDELRAFPWETLAEGEFHYGNKMYGPGDAEFLYSYIRSTQPRRMIEIGSGFSTLIARAAFKRNEAETGIRAEHICVEPFERRWLETSGATIIRKKVEDCDIALFTTLEDGDILFIDSTHVIRPQGDVLFEYQSIVPTLKPGVVVHVHDIFTPRDYPPSWVLRDRRLWNEQYLLEAFLCCNADFEVVCALNWLKNNHFDKLAAVFPALAAQPHKQPGAFWFRRKPRVRQEMSLPAFQNGHVARAALDGGGGVPLWNGQAKRTGPA